MIFHAESVALITVLKDFESLSNLVCHFGNVLKCSSSC